MNIVQVNGLKGKHLFDIWTEEKVLVSNSEDEPGRMDIIVGGKEFSIYLTKDWVDGTTFQPVTIRQYKLEDTE